MEPWYRGERFRVVFLLGFFSLCLPEVTQASFWCRALIRGYQERVTASHVTTTQQPDGSQIRTLYFDDHRDIYLYNYRSRDWEPYQRVYVNGAGKEVRVEPLDEGANERPPRGPVFY